MSSETFSVLIWCWHDLPTDTIQLRLVDVETGEEVRFKNSAFLLRISRDEGASLERYLIRHIASGREAHVQSGLGLRSFVKDCLLKNDAPGTTHSPASPGEPEGQS